MTDKQLINMEELKRRFSFSENTIRWLIRTNQIDFIRVGQRRIFFDPKDLEQWVQKNKVAAAEKRK